MHAGKVILGTALLVGALGLASSGPALAQTQRSADAHDHHAAAKLTLNNGKPWRSDAPLRQGMTRIRGIVGPQLGRIHAGKMDAKGYAAMATGIEAQVAYIVKTCKLDPEADAVLHVLVAEIMEGIDAMKAGSKTAPPETGAIKVVTALNSYGRYFEHPGWKPIGTGH